MKIGLIGLGRMGENMTLNLLSHNHKVVGYNRSPNKTKKLARKNGFTATFTLQELTNKLGKKKVIWTMIPAGKPIDNIIKQLIPLLEKGDIIIDGGNSYFKDSIKRYDLLKRKGINFLDVGVSGGVVGARNGACMMIGGDKAIFKRIEVLFKDMCVKQGYGYMGLSGAGHFVKGIHNGIEYGMLGSIAEGMNAIKLQEKRFKIDLNTVASVYSHGSVIESRLVSWIETGMSKPYFKKISGSVPKGETEEEMKKLEKTYKMNILKQARLMRVNSRKKPSFMGKLIAVVRNEFGGHKFKKK